MLCFQNQDSLHLFLTVERISEVKAVFEYCWYVFFLFLIKAFYYDVRFYDRTQISNKKQPASEINNKLV